MPYLLNVVYLGLLAVVSPWLAWAAVRHGKYRVGWGAKLFGLVPRRTGTARCMWFHAVSVGEVQMLRALLDRMDGSWSSWQCVISTTTKTGYELARKRYRGCLVFYCPLDFSWAVNAALRRVRPDLLVLVELELWPNLIAAAARRGVAVAVVNGRLSEQSYRGYRRIRAFLAGTLSRLSAIAVQNEEYAARFRQLGASAESLSVTGSLKFDGVQTDRANPETQRLVSLAGFSADDVVFLAGSTQHPEERLAIEAFQRLSPNDPRLRLVLAPRHPERFEEVAELLSRSSLPWRRRSALEQEGPCSHARILLVDTIGELSSWWGAAQIGFVGGSLGSRGGQNMMEPSAYGVAVSFGPHTQNFAEIVAQLLQHDAAVEVQDGQGLADFVTRCLHDDQWRQQLGDRARDVVLGQTGAAQKTWQCLRAVVDPDRPAHHFGRVADYERAGNTTPSGSI